MIGVAELALIGVVLAWLGVFRGSRRGSRDDATLTRAVRDLQRQLEGTEAELDEQRRQVAELAERLDFAERRLVQVQEARQIPPPRA